MKPPRRERERSWPRLLALSLALASLAAAIPTMTALAHDCLRDPLNAADCVRTPGARQIITTAIGVAGAAGVAIQNSINGRKPETWEEQEPRPEEEVELELEDPCASDRRRFEIAKANLRGLLASRARVQSFLTMLETQYENTRQSGYWNSAVSVGFLGASVWGRAIRGAIGMTVARTLAQNVAVSMAAAFGQQVAKNILDRLAGAGINPEDLVTQPLDSARNEMIKHMIKEEVLRDQMSVLGRGLNPEGPVYQAVRRGVDTNWASPAANLFGDTLSVLSLSSGILDAADKLEGLRGLIRRASSTLTDIDLKLEDARMEIELAQHSLDLCMQGESYARYLRRLAFSRLPSQG